MAGGRFTSETIETLGKRAALLCSNPDCGALTAGPTATDTGAVNIGEAAHIYGLTSTSARYNAALSAVELSDITNGVWLCRNCHKAADNDALRFPAELLFQWRRQHEAATQARLGKPGDHIRERLKEDQIKPFADASYLAQQIVLDRPKLWEFKLTVELLRSELGAVLTRWQRLKRGMLVQNSRLIDSDNVLDWLGAKNADIERIVSALNPLLKALNESFGPPGTPGDEKEILAVCRLIVSAATSLLEWEMDLRFAHVPERYREVLAAMAGLAGHVLEEIFSILPALSKIVSMENPTGTHNIMIVLDVPEGYVKRVSAAYKKIL